MSSPKWLWGRKDRSHTCWLWPAIPSWISEVHAKVPKAQEGNQAVSMLCHEVLSRLEWGQVRLWDGTSTTPTTAPNLQPHPPSWHHDTRPSVFLPSRYLEMGAKCVEKSFACAIIVITELERMSRICSKDLSKENRNVSSFQIQTSQRKPFWNILA